MADDLSSLEQRAQRLHEQGDVSDEALALNIAILARDHTSARATNRLGNAHVKRGELEDALAVFRDGLAANTRNAIAARKAKELERRVAAGQRALGEFVRRPPEEIVEPLVAGPGRASALRFLAFSIRAIQRLDGTRLAVTDIPSERRFRVVGGIYSAVTPWEGLLCVSIAAAGGGTLVPEVEAVGGVVTDRPGPMSAVPGTIQLGVPMPALEAFEDRLQRPHVEHLKASIEYGSPTWLHRHDPALMRYLLAKADAS
ncbi:MAG TPA: tetratricopeptide repeat protein [Solirubrobacteraceae bacterium]|nr:tetratricopeptide repeat protein [Solirubrobacteraceae bacterium]